MFNNLDLAIDWVNHQKKFNKRENLNDLTEANKLLGNPIDSYKIIHVGGTNGKGSTTMYLTNILMNKGLKVGQYVSPFVVKFNERISINHEYISDNDLLKYINKIYDFNIEFSIKHEPLAFFEIMTLMAFCYFKDNKIDIAVVEVGLGGRLDATNIVNPIVSAVTNIQKDHMKQLGNTYKKILIEKLGIMKENVPFCTSIDRLELIPIIKDYAINKISKLYRVKRISNIKLTNEGTEFTYKGIRYLSSLIGVHQAKNASLAIEIIDCLNENYNFDISTELIKKSLKETKWPGRFEIIKDDIILDGGHNYEGQLFLKKSIEEFTNKNIVVIYCAMKDKETEKMVKILDSYARRIIFTEIEYQRSEKSINLIKLSKINDKISFSNPVEAINYAISSKKQDEMLLFTGSLYFISFVRKYFME